MWVAIGIFVAVSLLVLGFIAMNKFSDPIRRRLAPRDFEIDVLEESVTTDRAELKKLEQHYEAAVKKIETPMAKKRSLINVKNFLKRDPDESEPYRYQNPNWLALVAELERQ